jgi:hypothetical protein
MLSNVIVPCTIIMSCLNIVASSVPQNYMMEHMKNASTTLAKAKTKGHLPHLTAGKEVAMYLKWRDRGPWSKYLPKKWRDRGPWSRHLSKKICF